MSDGRTFQWRVSRCPRTYPTLPRAKKLCPYRSHGFVIGHVTPEAQSGGPIALVQDGDMIHIDAESNTLTVDVSDAEMAKRRENWTAPPLKVSQGTLYKYVKLVSDASHGCGECFVWGAVRFEELLREKLG